MKILHIVGGKISKGAARGAYWTHLGLREIGVDSFLYVQSAEIQDDHVKTVEKTKFSMFWQLIMAEVIDKLPFLFYKIKKGFSFSSGLHGNKIRHLREYKEADIIHLHWVNGGMISMREIKKIKKPVVWTIRDMWAFTGGCHYAMDCERYTQKCGRCPALNSNRKCDITRRLLRKKKKKFAGDITLVGISNWVVESLNKSAVFKNHKKHVIHNCIDLDEFKPIDKRNAREILGLPSDKKLILCGAQYNSPWKGFDKFIQSLEYISLKDHVVLFFGKFDEKLISGKQFEYVNLGYIHDNTTLRLVYSAADVFVASSVQEAFGKTLIESMACGTPVVCFDATGPKDIVTHKYDGYKAKPFDTKDMASGIEWLLQNNQYNVPAEKAKWTVRQKFSKETTAKKYRDLYKRILKTS